jgi:predicted DNA-binding transcriptional regulator YafY
MGKKRVSPSPLPSNVSSKRVSRLCRLLQLLGEKDQTRASILRRLRIDVRTFYRDLELLRSCAIPVDLVDQRYHLEGRAAEAQLLLPFSDTGLTLGEATQLSKGRTRLHQKLKSILAEIIG